jgi:tetratricopeptide (TPR) repeat protein
MNLDDLLSEAAAQFGAEPDDLELHRQRSDLERFRARSADPERTCDLDRELELSAALDYAYQAACDAEERGDLGAAATCFRVAADQGVGDSSLRLAGVLLRLGEYDEAAQWCAVSIEEGFAGATTLLDECLVVRRKHRSAVALRTRHTHVLNAEDEKQKRRRFLAHAAAITVGVAVFGIETEQIVQDQPFFDLRVDLERITRLEAFTETLRQLDTQYGGMAWRDVAILQLREFEPLMGALCTGRLRERLALALADLHMLAGWMSFDSGLLDEARSHFTRALDLAKIGRSDALIADILYRAGRMHMHHEAYETALKLFQLGQLAAQTAGSPLHVALHCANEAWVYARLGRKDEALKLLSRARDELPPAAVPPGWRALRTEADTKSIIAVYLASIDPSDGKRGDAIALTALARRLLACGNTEAAVRAGDEALALAEKLHSSVADDYLRLLKTEAEQQPGATDLVRRIVARLDRAS